MSLLDRLNLLIRSEMNDIARKDRFRSAMGEMESSLKEARRHRVELRRSEKRLVEQIREARDKATRWEDRAVLALKNGDEDLAREALIMKNRTLDDVNRLRDELDDYRAQLKDLERALEALEMKLEGTRGRVESAGRPRKAGGGSRTRTEADWDAEMTRRRRGAGRDDSREYLDPIDDHDANFGADGTFREFDRMSDKIQAMDADAAAMDELSGDDWADPRKKELEEIFGRMEKKKRTDDDLEDLKKKFQ